MESIDPKTTALVIIDLQRCIASDSNNLGPYSASEVINNAKKLSGACRKKGIPVFPIHVKPTKDTALSPITDSSMSMSDMPPDWADFVPENQPQEKVIVITKHQWGAFYGTGLDMQLRRRGIKTIILCGISTNIGVESTARFAYEYGYNQVFAEDAMSAMSSEEHEMSVKSIFPRIGIVRNTDEIIKNIN